MYVCVGGGWWGGAGGVGDASCRPFKKLFADSLVSILISIIYFIYILIYLLYLFLFGGRERERDRRGGGGWWDLTPHHQVTGLYVSLNKANSTLPVELISQLYLYMKPILQPKGKKGRGSSEVVDRQA